MAKRLKKKRPSGARRLYRFLVGLSAVIVALWCVYKFSSRRPDMAEAPVRPDLPAGSVSAGQEDGLTRKEDTWTFLLCAEDQVSGHTDTIMVCTYDTRAQTMGLVSIPRDTLVDRPGWKYHKINAAYPNGGVEELQAAVSEVLGIPIDHYVLIDTDIFVALVDEVGGVDFDVPVHMSYDAPDQDLHIHYEPGVQHLTGQQALEVVRCRKNSDGKGSYPHNIYDAYPDADVGRTRTQQAMIKTIMKKALSKPHKVGSYVEIFSRYVKTDLSLANMLWFVEPALGFDMEDLTTATLPGDGTVRYKGTSYCYELDVEGSLEIINSCLNPYTTPVTADMARMIQSK